MKIDRKTLHSFIRCIHSQWIHKILIFYPCVFSVRNTNITFIIKIIFRSRNWLWTSVGSVNFVTFSRSTFYFDSHYFRTKLNTAAPVVFKSVAPWPTSSSNREIVRRPLEAFHFKVTGSCCGMVSFGSHPENSFYSGHHDLVQKIPGSCFRFWNARNTTSINILFHWKESTSIGFTFSSEGTTTIKYLLPSMDLRWDRVKTVVFNGATGIRYRPRYRR